MWTLHQTHPSPPTTTLSPTCRMSRRPRQRPRRPDRQRRPTPRRRSRLTRTTGPSGRFTCGQVGEAPTPKSGLQSTVHSTEVFFAYGRDGADSLRDCVLFVRIQICVWTRSKRRSSSSGRLYFRCVLCSFSVCASRCSRPLICLSVRRSGSDEILVLRRRMGRPRAPSDVVTCCHASAHCRTDGHEDDKIRAMPWLYTLLKSEAKTSHVVS